MLQVTCWQCGHSSEIYVAQLKKRWSDYERLIDLEARLRCVKCRNKARKARACIYGRLEEDIADEFGVDLV